MVLAAHRGNRLWHGQSNLVRLLGLLLGHGHLHGRVHGLCRARRSYVEEHGRQELLPGLGRLHCARRQLFSHHLCLGGQGLLLHGHSRHGLHSVWLIEQSRLSSEQAVVTRFPNTKGNRRFGR